MNQNKRLLVLSTLESKDMHGFEIIETLHNNLNNTFDLNEGTLYPLLHRLVNDRLLKTYTSRNRLLTYYKITHKGLNVLNTKRKILLTETNSKQDMMRFALC